MAAARYWRLIAVETRGYRADLQLAELALYDGAVRVDTEPTATIAPIAGAMSALSDGSTATSVTFSGADVTLPGFGIVWDLGTAKAVSEMRITPAENAPGFIYGAALQGSADGLAWVSEIDVYALAYPGDLTPAVAVYGDLMYGSAALVLNLNGANGASGAAAFVDGSPNAFAPYEFVGTTISTAQSKFGGASAQADVGGVLSFTSAGPEFATAGDWTMEFFIRLASLPAATQYLMASDATQYFTVDSGGFLTLYGYGSTPTTQLVVGTWHHVAVVHFSNDRSMLFFDGALLNDAFSLPGSAYGSLGIFSIPSYPFVPSFSNGHIDGVRITRALRYLGDFAPPVDQYPTGLPHAQSFRTLHLADLQAPAAVGYQNGGTTVRAPGIGMDDHRDVEDFGVHRVQGTVKEKSTPDNIPLRRRVQLYHQRSGRMIRELWSDEVTGAYSFDYIRGDAVYFVVAFDHLQNYRAVIADNITPELIA